MVVKVSPKTKNPSTITAIIETAVGGMLPKNKLRDPRLRRLKVFPGDKHTYQDKLKGKEREIPDKNQQH